MKRQNRPFQWLKIANILLIISFLFTAAIQTTPVFAEEGSTEPTIVTDGTPEPAELTQTPEPTNTPADAEPTAIPTVVTTDVIPPTASFINPIPDSTLTDDVLNLAVDANDAESGISHVDFYYSLVYPELALQSIASISSVPFETSLDVSGLNTDSIYLTADVFDGAGNSFTIPAIRVSLQAKPVQQETGPIQVLSVAPGVPAAFYPTRNALMDPTLTVAWTEPAPLADHFEIDFATDSGFSSIVESNTSVLNKSYKPATLLSNTTYYWRVRGISSDGTPSAWSPYSYFRTRLSAPIGLSQVVETTRPTLSWEAVTSATGYMITLDVSSTFSSSPQTYTTAATSFTIPTNLVLNKTYYWRVKTLGNNTSNWSSTSSFVSANPPSVPVLVSPETNTLLSGNQLTVKWKASSNKPVSYSIQLATDSGFSNIVSSHTDVTALTLTFTDYPLERNMKYYWRVRAFNAAGQYSQWSAARTVRTTMSAPILTTPVDESHEYTLRPTFTWEPVAGATSYTLQVALNNTFSLGLTTATPVSPTFTLRTDQKPNKTYFWRVKANGANPSGWSLISSYNSANPPSVPVLVFPADKALLNGYTVTLQWNESINNPNQYVLEYATNPTFSSSTVVDGLPNWYTIPTELTPNTTYYWRVRCLNDIGDASNWSAIRSFRTRLITPVQITPAEAANPHSLTPTFSWSPVDGAASYTLQIASNASYSTNMVKYTVKGASAYTIPVKLSVNKLYYWRVLANGSNPSLYSPTATFITPNPPSVPVLLTPLDNALMSNLSPTLDWKDATNNAVGYEIQLSLGTSFGTILHSYTAVASTIAIPDTLPANKTIFWRVRSLNADTDASSWSAARKLRTPMLPPVLTSPTEGMRTHTFRPQFTWETVTGASGYTIQISKDNTFTSGVVSSDTTATHYTRPVDLLQSSTYFWRVRANGTNTGMWSPAYSFLTIDPPSKPVLSTPANGAVLGTNAVTLDWADSTNSPQGYVLQYANNTLFTLNKVEVTGLGTSTYAIPSEIIDNRIYYWRVRSYKADPVDSVLDYSNWSSVFNFQGPDAPPVILAPENAAQLKVLQPTFSWEAVPDADEYTLQVSLYSNFSTNTSYSTTSTSITLTSDLRQNRTYYWRLKAEGAADEGWTTTRSFFTPDPPDVPSLVSPVDKKLLTDTTPTLKWSDADTTVEKYELQLATNTGFTKNLQTFTLDSTVVQYTLTTALDPDYDYYYWRVRALNIDEEASSWTATRSFTYRLPAPELIAPTNKAVLTTSKPKLDWDDVDNFDYYIVEVSKSSSFSSIFEKDTQVTTDFTMTKPVPSGTTMYWRVSAYSVNDVRGFYSDVYTFSYGAIGN